MVVRDDRRGMLQLFLLGQRCRLKNPPHPLVADGHLLCALHSFIPLPLLEMNTVNYIQKKKIQICVIPEDIPDCNKSRNFTPIMSDPNFYRGESSRLDLAGDSSYTVAGGLSIICTNIRTPKSSARSRRLDSLLIIFEIPRKVLVKSQNFRWMKEV